MHIRTRPVLLLTSLVTAAAVCGINPAHAARCLPIAQTIYVGNTSKDRSCNFNSIQAAIDSVVCPNTTIMVTSELSYTMQRLSIAGKSLAIVGTTGQCGPVIATTTLSSSATQSASFSSATQSASFSSAAPAMNAAALGSSATAVNVQAAASPPSKVTLSGVGSGGDSPVISVSGSSRVTLRNLEIRNGNVPLNEFGGSGGGISFVGSGTLALDNVTVAQNFAGFGGGISVTGTGGAAELRIGSNVLITGNTAQFDGGGVRVDGTTRLFMLGDASGIIFNHALGANGKGFGGGLEVVGPAIADIGSPGYFGLGAIYLNDALNGGGVAVVAGTGDASVRFFSVDGTRPVRVQGNTASQNGGGVFVKPFSDGSSTAFGMASMCASDFRITDNVATDGSAIFADVDTAAGGTKPWSSVVLNRPSTAQSMCPFPEPPTSFGAVPCAPGVLCNSIDGNATLAPNGTETPGATVLVQSSSFLYADRVRMSRNQSSHTVRANAGTGRLELTNSLLFGNLGGHFATNAGGGETILTQVDTVLDGCTFSRNQVGPNGPVIGASGALTLRRSIIDQHEVKNLVYTGPASGLVASHVMAITTVGLPAGPTMLFGQDPKFVSYDADDYHLQPTSPALDFAPTFAGDPPVDLDGLPRSQNLSTVTDRFGPRDLGAYERQP